MGRVYTRTGMGTGWLEADPSKTRHHIRVRAPPLKTTGSGLTVSVHTDDTP